MESDGGFQPDAGLAFDEYLRSCANPNGYRTWYLWEQVWQRDSWLDILARFVHLEVKERRFDGKTVRKETMISPRYHPLDSVRRLEAAR